MRKFLFAAGVLLALVASVAAAESAVKTVALDGDFAAAEILPFSGGGADYALISAAGAEAPYEPAGAPCLPEVHLLVTLPVKATVTGVSYAAEWVTIAEDVLVSPIQPPRVGDETPDFAPHDEALYAGAHPTANVYALEPVAGADALIVPVVAIPFRWANGRLEAARDFRVTVEYSAPSAAESSRASAFSVLSADEAPSVYATSNILTRANYIVLAPHDLMDAWTNYVAYRASTHPELTFAAVDTALVYATYPYDSANTDGAPRNPAESLRRYLQDERAAGNLEYVVLGGPWIDTRSVAAKELSGWYLQNGTALGIANAIPGVYANLNGKTGSENFEPSDQFFACLDDLSGVAYHWDYNGNGNYGESGEYGNAHADFTPDIVVSRISLKPICGLTPAQLLEKYMAKLARGEADDFAGRYRMGGTADKYYNEVAASSSSYDISERNFYDDAHNVFDPRVSQRYVDSERFIRYNFKSRFSGVRPLLGCDTMMNYHWTATEATEAAALKTYHTQDRDLQFAYAHGQVGSTAKWNMSDFMYATGLTKITMAGFPCVTGYLDALNGSYTYPSLGETIVTAPYGGGLAGIHNSRVAIGTVPLADNPESEGLSPGLNTRFTNALRDGMNIGKAWLSVIAAYAPGHTAYAGRHVQIVSTLYGDPLVRLELPEDQTWTAAEVPRNAKLATIAGGVITVTNAIGAANLTINGTTTITGGGSVKSMGKATVARGDLVWAVDGGVGAGGIVFSEKGDLTLAPPKKAYFEWASNVGTLTFAGTGATLNMGTQAQLSADQVVFAGTNGETCVGNTLRGMTAGQLANLGTMAISDIGVRFETVDAFGTDYATPLAAVTNGSITVGTNPYHGKSSLWEYIARPVTLSNSSLAVDYSQLVAFGREGSNGLQIDASGECAFKTSNSGMIKLYGTTTVALADDAEFHLAASIKPIENTNGRLVFTGGGRIVVDNAAGIEGELEVNGATLKITETLTGLEKLTLTGGAKLYVPYNEAGFYQISPMTATMTLSDSVKVYSYELDEDGNETNVTLVEGSATSTGSYFRSDALLTWNATEGVWSTDTNNVSPWAGGKFYADGDKVYFPNLGGGAAVSVVVSNAVNCNFAYFGNSESKYTFAADAAGGSLNLAAIQIGADTAFAMPVSASTSTDVIGGTLEAEKLTSPVITVRAGATLAADAIDNEITKIKAIRFIPLASNTDGNLRLAELEFWADGVNILRSSSYPWTVKTTYGDGVTQTGAVSYLTNGRISTTSSWDASFADSDDWSACASWRVNASNAALASGNCVIEYTFTGSAPMFTSYSLQSSYYAVKAPRAWKILVSVDGEYWQEVSSVTGQAFAQWSAVVTKTVGAAGSDAAVTVKANGALALQGEHQMTLTLEDGAILKATPGEAMSATGTTFVFPEAENAVVIDASALGLVRGETAAVLTGDWKIDDLRYFRSSAADVEIIVTAEGALAVTVGDDLAGPYHLATAGAMNWNTDAWRYTSGEDETTQFPAAWGELVTKQSADVIIEPTGDTTLSVDCAVTFDTLSAFIDTTTADTNATESTTRSFAAFTLADGGGSLFANRIDLGEFEATTRIQLDTGTSTIVAGVDTVIDAASTGGTLELAGGKLTFNVADTNSTLAAGATGAVDFPTTGVGNRFALVGIAKAADAKNLTAAEGRSFVVESGVLYGVVSSFTAEVSAGVTNDWSALVFKDADGRVTTGIDWSVVETVNLVSTGDAVVNIDVDGVEEVGAINRESPAGTQIKIISDVALPDPYYNFEFDGTFEQSGGQATFAFTESGTAPEYVAARGGQAMTKCTHWTNGTTFDFGSGAYTVTATARMTTTVDAIAFSWGQNSTAGLALTSKGADEVSLGYWKSGMSAHTNLIEATVSDAAAKFHFYAIRVNGTTVDLFVDGSKAGTAEITTVPTKAMQFHNLHGNLGYGFSAGADEALDNFSLYRSALTGLEITALASENPVWPRLMETTIGADVERIAFEDLVWTENGKACEFPTEFDADDSLTALIHLERDATLIVTTPPAASYISVDGAHTLSIEYAEPTNYPGGETAAPYSEVTLGGGARLSIVAAAGQRVPTIAGFTVSGGTLEYAPAAGGVVYMRDGETLTNPTLAGEGAFEVSALATLVLNNTTTTACDLTGTGTLRLTRSANTTYAKAWSFAGVIELVMNANSIWPVFDNAAMFPNRPEFKLQSDAAAVSDARAFILGPAMSGGWLKVRDLAGNLGVRTDWNGSNDYRGLDVLVTKDCEWSGCAYTGSNNRNQHLKLCGDGVGTHVYTLAGASTSTGTLTVTNGVDLIFAEGGKWTGPIVVADAEITVADARTIAKLTLAGNSVIELSTTNSALTVSTLAATGEVTVKVADATRLAVGSTIINWSAAPDAVKFVSDRDDIVFEAAAEGLKVKYDSSYARVDFAAPDNAVLTARAGEGEDAAVIESGAYLPLGTRIEFTLGDFVRRCTFEWTGVAEGDLVDGATLVIPSLAANREIGVEMTLAPRALKLMIKAKE